MSPGVVDALIAYVELPVSMSVDVAHVVDAPPMLVVNAPPTASVRFGESVKVFAAVSVKALVAVALPVIVHPPAALLNVILLRDDVANEIVLPVVVALKSTVPLA